MKRLETEGLEIVARLMAVSARTAPKTGGADLIHTRILTNGEKDAVVAAMREIGERKALRRSRKDRAESVIRDWSSDAKSIEDSNLLFLVGIQGKKAAHLDCGGCGFTSCAEMTAAVPMPRGKADFSGPFCMFRIMDLSLAVGSAAGTAMTHNVDNRIMQKAGVAALELGTLQPCDLILGIPLSATGKNIFFDRPDKLAALKTLRERPQ